MPVSDLLHQAFLGIAGEINNSSYSLLCCLNFQGKKLWVSSIQRQCSNIRNLPTRKLCFGLVFPRPLQQQNPSLLLDGNYTLSKKILQIIDSCKSLPLWSSSTCLWMKIHTLSPWNHISLFSPFSPGSTWIRCAKLDTSHQKKRGLVLRASL